MPQTPSLHPIVIAGGGAGGLELASRLGRRFGPERIILVDQSPFHVWKPSLHEVAAGTLDIHQEGLSYAMLARIGGFTFVPGRITGVDRETRELRLDAWRDAEGEVILDERVQPYGQLVMAVGSLGHFFGTPAPGNTPSRWTPRRPPKASGWRCSKPSCASRALSANAGRTVRSTS